MIDIADDEARVVDDAALDGELFAVRRDEARGGRASLAGEKERGDREGSEGERRRHWGWRTMRAWSVGGGVFRTAWGVGGPVLAEGKIT